MARPRTATSILDTTGAFERNPNRKRSGEPEPPGTPPIKPKLKGRASRIWDEYAPICIGMKTLARGDELEFATWCQLQAQFEKEGDRFTTTRLAQKRTYAALFGISGPGSRAKMSVSGKDAESKEHEEKYFSTPGKEKIQ